MRKALLLASALVVVAFAGSGLLELFASMLQSRAATVDENRRRPGVPELPEDLSSQALVHLEGWLRRVRQDEGVSPPRRDIFRKVTEPDPVNPLPIAQQSSPEASPLQLVGFIFSGGPEGEENPSAAVRFEGRMLLVREGDSVGAYRVKSMVVGEEIELTTGETTGETIRLLLN